MIQPTKPNLLFFGLNFKGGGGGGSEKYGQKTYFHFIFFMEELPNLDWAEHLSKAYLVIIQDRWKLWVELNNSSLFPHTFYYKGSDVAILKQQEGSNIELHLY